jgi:hypothetical protein
VQIGARTLVVTKNDKHPEEYLYVTLEEKKFFLGVLEKGMTRGDVKRMAVRWLQERERAIRRPRRG